MMRRKAGRWLGALFLAGAAVAVTSCNAAIGGGVVAVLGGAGLLAGQCYDRVRIRVRDPHTGQTTCNANVWVSDDGGSERRLRPCYNAALTEGTWKLTARQAGYRPVSTELTIPERNGECPHYTHSIELTLRREGEPSTPPVPARSATAGSGKPSSTTGTSGTNPLETPPARVVPPPIPGAPVVPTRSFDPVPAAPTAPTTPPTPVPPPAPPAGDSAPR